MDTHLETKHLSDNVYSLDDSILQEVFGYHIVYSTERY